MNAPMNTPGKVAGNASGKRRPHQIAFGTAAIAAVALPFLVDQPFVYHIATAALVWALLAASWDLLSGYTGQISFGHAGFYTIGAYAAALTTLHLGVSPFVGMLVAIVFCAVMGLFVGFPALRLRGHYLALVTLAFGEIVGLVARNWEAVTGGSFGLHNFPSFRIYSKDIALQPAIAYGVVACVSGAALVFLLLLTRRSKAGPAFRAIREDEVLAQSLGINTTYFKLLAFMVSAGMAGLAGALHAFHIDLVTPSLGTVGVSAFVIGSVIFGGFGTIWGAFLGGAFLYLITEGLRFIGVVYNLVAVGLVMMAFVLFVPNGIAGLRWKRNKLVQRADLPAKEEQG